MSADNFLGIYKTDKGEFIGRGCWSECERDHCSVCSNVIIFNASSLPEAIEFAQEVCNGGDYEYGYKFLNFNHREENTQNKGEAKMNRFFIIFVEHTDGGRHYRHDTPESARVEAERLAKLPENIGKYVYVFECIGRCRVEETPIKWDVY